MVTQQLFMSHLSLGRADGIIQSHQQVNDRAQTLFQASGILVKHSLFHEGMSYDSHAFSAFKFQVWNSMLNMDSLPLLVDLWVNSVFHNMMFYNRWQVTGMTKVDIDVFWL